MNIISITPRMQYVIVGDNQGCHKGFLKTQDQTPKDEWRRTKTVVPGRSDVDPW